MNSIAFPGRTESGQQRPEVPIHLGIMNASQWQNPTIDWRSELFFGSRHGGLCDGIKRFGHGGHRAFCSKK
jgi:hypothetical protein